MITCSFFLQKKRWSEKKRAFSTICLQMFKVTATYFSVSIQNKAQSLCIHMKLLSKNGLNFNIKFIVRFISGQYQIYANLITKEKPSK